MDIDLAKIDATVINEVDAQLEDMEDRDIDEGGTDASPEAEEPVCTGQRSHITANTCGLYETEVESVCVASSAGNLSLRFSTDAACAAEVVCLQSITSTNTHQEHDGEITTDHHLVLWGLPDDVSMMCDLFCHCPYGQNIEILLGGMEVFVEADLGLRITEILIDPNGPEPDQEFVEVVNTTGSVLDISGWRLADAPAPECSSPTECAPVLDGYGDVIPDGTLIPPMEPVLLVSSKYNTGDPLDPSPPPSCEIIRLDTSLGDRGLRNSSGEVVFIIDGEGGVASFYPNVLGTMTEGVSIERVHLQYPDGNVLTWMENPSGTSTPGEM